MMLSFDFSVFDLVLSLGVIVMIALFVVTIWKLNPGKEKTRSEDEEIRIEEHEPMFSHQQNPTKSPSDVQPSQVDTWQSGGRAVPQSVPTSRKLVVNATIDGDSQINMEESPETNEYVEPQKQTKTTSSSKPTHKNTTSNDCFHFFGYLNGLPRNTPIPGECFGCQKIVDCLVTKKK